MYCQLIGTMPRKVLQNCTESQALAFHANVQLEEWHLQIGMMPVFQQQQFGGTHQGLRAWLMLSCEAFPS